MRCAMKQGSRIVRRVLALNANGKRVLRYLFVEPLIRRTFAGYGSPVRIPKGCTFSGAGNICVGDHVYFGANTRVLTTNAKLIIIQTDSGMKVESMSIY